MSDGTPKPATWPMWRGPLAYGHATATRIRRLCAPDSMVADDTAERFRDRPAKQCEERREHEEERGYDRNAWRLPLLGRERGTGSPRCGSVDDSHRYERLHRAADDGHAPRRGQRGCRCA